MRARAGVEQPGRASHPALEMLGVEVGPYLPPEEARRSKMVDAAVAMSSISRRKGGRGEQGGEDSRAGGGGGGGIIPPGHRLGLLRDPSMPLTSEELDGASLLLTEQFDRARDSIRLASPHHRSSHMSDAVVVNAKWRQNAQWEEQARSPDEQRALAVKSLSAKGSKHSEFIDVFLREPLSSVRGEEGGGTWEEDDVDPDWFLGEDEGRRREVSQLDASTGVSTSLSARGRSSPPSGRRYGLDSGSRGDDLHEIHPASHMGAHGYSGGVVAQTFSSHRPRESFDAVDTNGDGVIDREELARFRGQLYAAP